MGLDPGKDKLNIPLKSLIFKKSLRLYFLDLYSCFCSMQFTASKLHWHFDSSLKNDVACVSIASMPLKASKRFGFY